MSPVAAPLHLHLLLMRSPLQHAAREGLRLSQQRQNLMLMPGESLCLRMEELTTGWFRRTGLPGCIIPHRYDLFDPRSIPFLAPLEYIDVFRYSDSNVTGYCHHVDCWYTDEVAGQIPGPWIGKTTFNLRLPSPKPGCVIQNGRPTKIELNSNRPEYMWVEEWRHMARKGARSRRLTCGRPWSHV